MKLYFFYSLEVFIVQRFIDAFSVCFPKNLSQNPERLRIFQAFKTNVVLFINHAIHPNIQFTIETENNKKD